MHYFPYYDPKLYQYLTERGLILPAKYINTTSFSPHCFGFCDDDLETIRFCGRRRRVVMNYPDTLELCDLVAAAFPHLVFMDNLHRLWLLDLITFKATHLRSYRSPEFSLLAIIDTDNVAYIGFYCLELNSISPILLLYDLRQKKIVFDDHLGNDPLDNILAFFYIPERQAIGIKRENEFDITIFPETSKVDFQTEYDLESFEFCRHQILVMDKTTFFIPYNPNCTDLEYLFSRRDIDWEIHGKNEFTRKKVNERVPEIEN